MVKTSNDWIIERTGIHERRICAPDEASSDLAYHAARNALSSAALKPKDLDLIIVATSTPDSTYPSTACILQAKLSASRAFAFDINAACTGFLYALSVGQSYIMSKSAKRVLVVGAETMTRFINWEDRATCVLFGDGAGAAVLEPTDGKRGVLSVELYSDGTLGDIIVIPAGGSRMPASIETIQKHYHTIIMRGNELFKVAVKSLEKAAVDILEHNKMSHSDIDLLVPHQANLRIIHATAKRLKLPMEKVMVNLERYGNTSAASIPIALDEASSTGRMRDGDIILLDAFGGGLTWGAALIRW
jgi:3-oxoacyl-[acyl-carrier-protein] synthase-3